jgi:hypothetical protein
MALAGTAAGQEASVTAELRAGKKEFYVFEAFNLELAIRFTGVRIGQSFQLQGLPDEKLVRRGDFGELPSTREMHNGTLHEVRRFRCEMTALTPGAFRIAPVLRMSLLRRQMGLFGAGWSEQPYELPVTPVEIRALALPSQGRPEAFSGAVGSFTMRVDVAPSEVAVGDLVKVSATVRGRGHLEEAGTPRIEDAAGFKSYDWQKVQTGVSGEVRFEKTLIPGNTNAAIVPPVSFCYFDSGTARYETLREGPFPLRYHERKVDRFEPYRSSPPAGGQSVASAEATAGRQEGVSGRDIRLAAVVAGYWFAAAALTAFVFRHGRRLRWLAVLVPVIALLAMRPVTELAGRGGARAEEGTVRAGVPARWAPTLTAETLAEIPGGAAVRIRESWTHWRRVEWDGRSGWIPAEALKETGVRRQETGVTPSS